MIKTKSGLKIISIEDVRTVPMLKELAKSKLLVCGTLEEMEWILANIVARTDESIFVIVVQEMYDIHMKKLEQEN